MTATTTEFGTATKLRQVLTAAGSPETKAKLDRAPEPSVLKQMLDILVGFGYLSAEQAHELWKALTGGGYGVLPPVPFPDAVTGKLTIYDVFRLAYTVRADDAQFDIVDTVQAIGTAIVTIVHTIETVGDAVSSAWGWFTGLFS